MIITYHEEEVLVRIYMSGTIVCANTLSPIQQQLEDCPRIVLTNWYHQSVYFPKGSHSQEKEYLFACIVAIHVYALRSKFHETEIYLGLRNTIHNPSFIAKRIVSQVRIANIKVPDATIITDLEEDFFEGHRQDVTSHRTLT